MMKQKPLAAVMVADPTPLTLANLKRLSAWCDLVLSEATMTFQGEPRKALRAEWRDLLGLEPPHLQVITTDLSNVANRSREAVQRNGAALYAVKEPEDRPVLLVDSDELLYEGPILDLIEEGIEKPVRLGLTALYGAVDRVARSIHCCWKPEWPDLRRQQPEKPYLVPAPALATAGMLRDQSANAIRSGSRLIARETTFGLHLTLTEPVRQIQWKLQSTGHVWDARIYDETHLQTMLTAGIHHAGWWVSNYREPETWLLELASQCGLRVAGPMLPEPCLRALRAWAEVRLDPRIPAELIRAGDAYVSTRAANVDDFLGPLDNWLCTRPVEYCGHATKEAATNG